MAVIRFLAFTQHAIASMMAPVGLWVAHQLDNRLLMGIFAVLLLVVATVAAVLWWLTDPTTPAMARVWVYMVAGVSLILTLHRNPREVVTRWL